MFASCGRARLAYDVSGSGGEDVLLIHAGVNDRRSRHDVVERLAPRHRVVAYDARGYVGRLETEDVVAADEQAAALIPGARLRWLDGVAHVPHLEGDPVALHEIVGFVDAH